MRGIVLGAWCALVAALPLTAGAQLPGQAGFRTQAEEREIFVEKLKRDIAKVARAIEVTEQLIARSRGAPYLPDIYLRLAELYVEQSRYEFYLVNDERDASGSAVAPTARLLKDKAIETYRRILSDFPKWEDNDKVTFFLAHELRELGEYEDMLATYQRLADRFPKSPLVLDAYLVLGDYRFDKSDLDGAATWYRRILDAPSSPTHDIAHFKMGWVALNKADFPTAFGHFEAAVKTPWAPPGQGRDDARRLDVKREALVDLAYAYTEVKKPQGALGYFRKLAPSRSLYVLALDKLARRYFIKQDFDASARVFRELARLSYDPVENLDRTSQVYQAEIKTATFRRVDQDMAQMLDALDQYRFDWRVGGAEREAAAEDIELQARDLATRAQQKAIAKKDRRLGTRVSEAYARYLQSFPRGERRAEIVENLADTLYEAKRFLEAGDRYEEAARILDDAGAQREALYNACAAFRQALEVGGPTLPRFERLWAQRGLIQNGRSFVERYPDSPKVAEIELNIGRSYFEGGELVRAVGVFEEFLDRHPKDKRAVTVADLILDAFAQQKDFPGLAEKARELAGRGLGGPKFAARMEKTARAAEERQIGEVILTASVDNPGDEDAGARLRAYWEDNKASPVAERTLYTAFVQYKEARDYEQVFATGNQFIGAYPKSEFLGDVFGTLAAFTSQVGAFDQAAVYLEELEARFPRDASAQRQLARAAELRQLLGDHEGAAKSYRRLFEQARSAESLSTYGGALLDSLRELERWDDVRAVSNKLLKSELKPVKASLLLGLRAQRSGELEPAAAHFRRAAEAAGRSAEGQAREDGAEAAFRLGAVFLERFRAANGLGDLEAVTSAKVELLGALEAAMVDAAGFGVGEWVVAGLHRVAMGYAEMASFLAEAPVPPELSADDQAVYRAAVEEQVSDLEDRADELFSTCIARAVELEIISSATRGCLAQGGEEAVAAVRPAAAVATGPAARKELEASLTRRPEDLDAVQALVAHFLADGEPARAKLMAGRGLEIDDRDARLYALIGAAELALGRASQAYAAFGRAAELGHPYAVVNQAALLDAAGAEEAALQLLADEDIDELPERAVDLHPGAAALLARSRS